MMITFTPCAKNSRRPPRTNASGATYAHLEWLISTTLAECHLHHRNPRQSRELTAIPIDPGDKPVIRCPNKVATRPWSATEPKGRATEVKYEVQAAVRPSRSFPLCFHSECQRTRCRRSCRHAVAMHAE